MSSPLSDDSEVLLATEEEKSDCHLVVDDADSPAPSPSNSPPLKEEQPDTKAANFASSRRRSHEDTSTASEHVDQKSQSAMNEPQANPVKVQGLEKTPELPNHDTASVAAHAIPPPPAAGQMPPPSMRPQRSRQGSRTNPHPEPIAKAAEGPAETSQQRDPSGEDAMSDDVGMCESTTFGEPREQIENFNWQDLEQRYHDKMGQLNAEENDIMVEFDQLCNYFGIWAQAGATQEVDRSFKRIKTQMTFVQHEEDELEKKRLHYIKVVEAFKSALSLLSA